MFAARSAVSSHLNRIALAVQAEQASGQSFWDLTVSNPTTAGLPYEKEPLLAALRSEQALVYAPEPFGLESARAAVAARYRALEPERVVLTASTSEAYSFAFKLLCDAGDEVLVPAPSYPLLEHLATLEQVVVRPYALVYEGSWHVDLASVRAGVTARTRGIVVVSPNNPTSSYLKPWELSALLELGLPIISDEVFGTYPLGAAADRVSTVLEAEDGLVLALDGLSKRAALPQLKLAWLALGGSPRLVTEARARLELIADTFLSVATPVQLALPALLTATESTHGAILARVRRNYARAREIVRGSPVSVLNAEGGWYAVLRLPRTQSEEDWVLALLGAQVLVQPGYFYDFADEAYVIVSLLTEEAAFERGVGRLTEYVAAHTR